MIRNYRDYTMGSIFRGTDQPPTRSALLSANWRGCEGAFAAVAVGLMDQFVEPLGVSSNEDPAIDRLSRVEN